MQRQAPGSKAMRPEQLGHPAASEFQSWPVATQMTSGAADAAHVDERVVGVGDDPGRRRGGERPRQRSASLRTSWVRSSWSRLRFSSTTVPAPVAASTSSTHRSSTSSTAVAAGSATPRAATMPGVMLAPSELETTGPVGAEGGADQAGGRGLAVGGAHDHDLAAAGELAQQVAVDEQGGPPADHAAGAEVHELRGPGDGPTGGDGEPGPGRQAGRGGGVGG